MKHQQVKIKKIQLKLKKNNDKITNSKENTENSNKSSISSNGKTSINGTLTNDKSNSEVVLLKQLRMVVGLI